MILQVLRQLHELQAQMFTKEMDYLHGLLSAFYFFEYFCSRSVLCLRFK